MQPFTVSDNNIACWYGMQQQILTNKPLNEDTLEIKTKKYQYLLHIRHDLVHFLVNCILGQKHEFRTHITLGKLFDFLPNELGKLAPDIIIEDNGTLCLMDISCSNNPEYNLNEKLAKYQPVLDFFSTSPNMKVLPFHFIWVDTAWTNLEGALQNLETFCSDNCLPFFNLEPDLLQRTIYLFELLNKSLNELRLVVLDVTETPFNAPQVNPLDVARLKEISESQYPPIKKILSELDDIDINEVEKLFSDLVEDEEVFKVLEDTKHDDSMYQKAFTHLSAIESDYPKGNVKPTFFIPFVPSTPSINTMLSAFTSHLKPEIVETLQAEQINVIKFLNFTKLHKLSNGLSFFLKELCNQIEECLVYPGELNIFNTGLITGSYEQEVQLNQKYSDYRVNIDTSISKRTFFKKTMEGTTDLKDELPYIYRNKCIKLDMTKLKKNSFLDKSGTSYFKTHDFREYELKHTIEETKYKSFSDFMDLLEEKECQPYAAHPYLGNYQGCDADQATKIKNDFLLEQREFMGFIQTKHIHSMAKHTSNIASQLLHFNELNTTDSCFCVMNSGRTNMLHIVRGGSVKRGGDVGQAYFSLFITQDLRWVNEVYGEIEVSECFCGSEKFYLCVTPWVRISSERLTFIKDQYYSTLSTAYDTWARCKDTTSALPLLRHCYTFRSCVSMCPTQKVAELLMDTRYIFMSALSKFSNVEELIKDKFAPPYKNCLEQYIVRRLNLQCQKVIIYLKHNPPEPNRPGYLGTKRLQATLGGSLSLPSLWSDMILTNIQSIFDDIFVYVHTSKEPSSEYHEQIKAMNTILKFQSLYDMSENNIKHGSGTFEEYKQWILSGQQIGCCSKIIYHGTQLFAQGYEGLYKRTSFLKNTIREPLSEIVSTKACIPEYDRKIKINQIKQKKMNNIIKNLGKLQEIKKDLKGIKIRDYIFKIDVHVEDNAEINITQSGRVKVHDALLDWCTRDFSDKQFVLDLVNWNITKNNCRVIADTCIKAQYGAKREFYVINLGAKGMARLTENSYKEICNACPNEMISVPGDKKFEYIQQSLNHTLLSSNRKQDQLYFVNGDCTKWSACETMASFISMNVGLKDVLGDVLTWYNNVTFSAWANKNIQIPQTILDNLKFITEQTSYITEKTTIHSTQNFLQGMFNYSSSLKAVISTEFAIYMFKKKNPGIFLHVSHLEHSDDYNLSVRVKDEESFIKFRVYHKLAQKMFGINDSIKKTNIQQHISEFISLFSFNGQLFYPNIKKMKEVGTNLSCLDYRSDAMAISSRVSEAVRLGIPLNSAYFMQRVHCCTIADAYSLSPKRRNHIGNEEDIFNRPLELFGLPDCLPIVTPLVKGNIENYRLYKYSKDEKTKNVLKCLYNLNTLTFSYTDLPIEEYKDQITDLLTPVFSYPIRKNKLKAIQKKLKTTRELVKEYFQNNMTDCLLKPVETNRFISWLRAMYFNNSFAQAYTKVGRATMSLRHSLFSSKPCIRSLMTMLDPEQEMEFVSVKTYYWSIFIFMEENQHVKFIENQTAFLNSLSCHTNTVELFYSMMEKSTLIKMKEVASNTTVQRMPSPYAWISLENNISVVLQYMLNYDNFVSDFRNFISDVSIYRDSLKVKKFFNYELLTKTPAYARQVFKEVLAQRQARAYGLVFEPETRDLSKYIIQYMQQGLNYYKTYKLLLGKEYVISDFMGRLPLYLRDNSQGIDSYTGVLSHMALWYRVIRLQSNYNYNMNCQNFLETTVVNDKLSTNDYLKSMTIQHLKNLGLGENTKKILAILKLALLNDPKDALDLITDSMYYDYMYLKKMDVPDYFTEGVVINFRSIQFKAFTIGQFKKNQEVMLIMPKVNRSFWFYGYTIAQKLFGIINQTELDRRFSEGSDLSLPVMGDNMKKAFMLHTSHYIKGLQMYYLFGKHIKPCKSNEMANIPIITTDYKKMRHKGIRQPLETLGRLHLDGLTLYAGNLNMFTLPFGNLPNIPCYNSDDPALSNICIDGLSAKILCYKDNLMKYLKTDLELFSDQDLILKYIIPVWENYKKNESVGFQLETVKSIFNPELQDVPLNKVPDLEPTPEVELGTKFASSMSEFKSGYNEPLFKMRLQNNPEEKFVLETLEKNFLEKNKVEHAELTDEYYLGQDYTVEAPLEVTSLDLMKTDQTEDPKGESKTEGIPIIDIGKQFDRSDFFKMMSIQMEQLNLDDEKKKKYSHLMENTEGDTTSNTDSIHNKHIEPDIKTELLETESSHIETQENTDMLRGMFNFGSSKIEIVTTPEVSKPVDVETSTEEVNPLQTMFNFEAFKVEVVPDKLEAESVQEVITKEEEKTELDSQDVQPAYLLESNPMEMFNLLSMSTRKFEPIEPKQEIIETKEEEVNPMDMFKLLGMSMSKIEVVEPTDNTVKESEKEVVVSEENEPESCLAFAFNFGQMSIETIDKEENENISESESKSEGNFPILSAIESKPEHEQNILQNMLDLGGNRFDTIEIETKQDIIEADIEEEKVELDQDLSLAMLLSTTTISLIEPTETVNIRQNVDRIANIVEKSNIELGEINDLPGYEYLGEFEGVPVKNDLDEEQLRSIINLSTKFEVVEHDEDIESVNIDDFYTKHMIEKGSRDMKLPVFNDLRVFGVIWDDTIDEGGIFEDTNYESLSSEPSDSSDEYISSAVDHYNILPSESLLSQSWGYESRARNNMLPLSKFFICAWVDNDVNNLLSHQDEIGDFLKLVSNITSAQGIVKANSLQKAILEATLARLNHYVLQESKHYRVGKNLAIISKHGKIEFQIACGFETKAERDELCNEYPDVIAIHKNIGFNEIDSYWAAEVADSVDVTQFLKAKYTRKEFSRISAWSLQLNSLIKKYDMLPEGLKGRYRMMRNRN